MTMQIDDIAYIQLASQFNREIYTNQKRPGSVRCWKNQQQQQRREKIPNHWTNDDVVDCDFWNDANKE